MQDDTKIFAGSVLIIFTILVLTQTVKTDTGCLDTICTDLRYCTHEFLELSSKVKVRKCICTKTNECQLHLKGCYSNSCRHGFFAFTDGGYRCLCSYCALASSDILYNSTCTTEVGFPRKVCGLGNTSHSCNMNACGLDICKNGTCVVDFSGYHCDCYPDFTGLDCETATNCLVECDCEYANRLEKLATENPKPEEEIEKEMQPYLTELKQNLTLNSKNLSSAARKKISATDDRKSSQVIGTVGIIFLIFTIGLIVAGDVYSLTVFVVNRIHSFTKAKCTTIN